MNKQPKASQLQLRISDQQKKELRKLAAQAGVDMSSWILAKLFPPLKVKFQKLVEELDKAKDASFVFAELNDFLSKLSKSEFEQSLTELPRINSEYRMNYLAAMVELAASKLVARVPAWTKKVRPLSDPVFACDLESLRFYLLANSPAPFRARNIFIDSSLGDRV